MEEGSRRAGGDRGCAERGPVQPPRPSAPSLSPVLKRPGRSLPSVRCTTGHNVSRAAAASLSNWVGSGARDFLLGPSERRDPPAADRVPHFLTHRQNWNVVVGLSKFSIYLPLAFPSLPALDGQCLRKGSTLSPPLIPAYCMALQGPVKSRETLFL
jgi:hypothetical protein